MTMITAGKPVAFKAIVPATIDTVTVSEEAGMNESQLMQKRILRTVITASQKQITYRYHT